jgi:hypothetical protein
MNTNDPVDLWLDDAMKTDIDSAVGTDAPPPPRYRNSTSARRLRLVGLTTIPLALSFRLVTALAAGGLAAAGGTAVLVSSHTHGTAGGTASTSIVVSSASPHTAAASNHGSVVTSAVASCKAARPSPDASPKPSPGSRGIGSCVSIVASGGRSKGADTGGSDTKPSHPTPKPHPSSGS